MTKSAVYFPGSSPVTIIGDQKVVGELPEAHLPVEGRGVVWQTIVSDDVSPLETNKGYVFQTGGVQREAELPASVPEGFNVQIVAQGGEVLVLSNGNVIEGVGSGNDLLLDDGECVTLVGTDTGELDIAAAAIPNTGDDPPPGAFVLQASEALAARDLVSIWDDGGTPKVRKAKADAWGYRADGFVKEAVSSASDATCYKFGIVTGFSGLTPGVPYFLSLTPGAITDTAPVGTVGYVRQTVGVPHSSSSIYIVLGEPIKIREAL